MVSCFLKQMLKCLISDSWLPNTNSRLRHGAQIHELNVLSDCAFLRFIFMLVKCGNVFLALHSSICFIGTLWCLKPCYVAIVCFKDKQKLLSVEQSPVSVQLPSSFLQGSRPSREMNGGNAAITTQEETRSTNRESSPTRKLPRASARKSENPKSRSLS